MISVSEAEAIIQSHLFPLEKEKVEIIASTGRVLAEPVTADRDFPPFDRVTMDGIALAFTTYQNGQRKFNIAGVQAAGQPRLKLSDPSSCIEAMTGAMLPEGADTVVPYEDIEISEGTAFIKTGDLKPGSSLHSQGIDARKGSGLLSPGILISPAEVAVLASVGMTHVTVVRMPRVAVVATGDELVEIDANPLPHQIRRSNTLAIQSALRELGATCSAFHIADKEDELRIGLSKIFAQHDVVILSGGVSKGKLDFVPAVLESLGVKKLFHQVRQRPGKPFWLGASTHHTVFALPGNPVSTFMCFYRYIKPWLLASMGTQPEKRSAILAEDISFTPNLTYFLQVRTQFENGMLMASPEAGGGSGDFMNLRDATGFLELPAEKNQFKSGEIFPYIPFRRS